MLVKHFDRQGPTFEISSALRSQVVFRKHNLLDSPPMGGPFDIVFLRNVLIYFDVATKREVFRKVRGSSHRAATCSWGPPKPPLVLTSRGSESNSDPAPSTGPEKGK